jgi:hypothetical protein
MILDSSVPVWVRVYDVPRLKQNKATGVRFGNALGKYLEVDIPDDDEHVMNEFLRVRVALPCDRRLQTQITSGVKGRPRVVHTYKLKYDRVLYYCSHCGFMGHKHVECEKKRRGSPSLDYEVYQLRCSPYKKYEHRTYFVPSLGQPRARR